MYRCLRNAHHYSPLAAFCVVVVAIVHSRRIDPFGHSAFQGSVMSSPVSGFNALFFMRADWQDIARRQNTTTTEFIWAPSPTLGLAQGATFAGILYGGYCTVGGLSMDIYSEDAPVMDDTALEDYNVPAIVARLVEIAQDALKSVPQGGAGADGTLDIMLPLGCDFEYENAGTWFTNTDKIIHYANLNGTVNAFYSTPAIYAAAKLEAGRAYSLTNGSDLFPYDFFKNGYLTGFYTSRPALKGYIRETSSVMQAAKQLQALTAPPADASLPSNALYRLERGCLARDRGRGHGDRGRDHGDRGRTALLCRAAHPPFSALLSHTAMAPHPPPPTLPYSTLNPLQARSA